MSISWFSTWWDVQHTIGNTLISQFFDPVCFNTPQRINFANFDVVRCFNTICREFIYQYYDFWLKTCAQKPAPVMPVGFHKYMSSPKNLGVTLLGTHTCHALWSLMVLAYQVDLAISMSININIHYLLSWAHRFQNSFVTYRSMAKCWQEADYWVRRPSRKPCWLWSSPGSQIQTWTNSHSHISNSKVFCKTL